MRLRNDVGDTRFRSRAWPVVAATTLLLFGVAAAPGRAQEKVGSPDPVWFNGMSIGLPGYAKEAAPSLFTVGFHGSHVRHARPGLDYSVGTMPRALLEGVIALGARGGLVLPLALSSDMILLPSGGASFLGGFGTEGGGAELGANLGLGMFVLDGDQGLRFGATWHHFGEIGGPVWLLEFGFVRAR